MKRRELQRWLRRNGARVHRHGAEHDIWIGPNGRRASVPRHPEVNMYTARGICDDLGVPRPPGR
jgi:hypothetical protein